MSSANSLSRVWEDPQAVPRILQDIEVGPDGSTQIFLRPLEGCYSRAPTLQEALQKAPSKVRGYLTWLQEHGEDVSRDWWDAPIEECEVVRGDWPVNLGDSVALFECDRGPMAEEEIQRNLRWMTYSWKDFLELLGHVPEDAWDWKPPGQRRSIRRIVHHVALVMVWYVMKLRRKGVDPPFHWPRGLSMWRAAREVEKGDLSPNRLTELREACAHRLRNLRPQEMEGRVTYHRPGGWTKRTEPEAWTARKVFRRFLWHERLHMRTMVKMLAAYGKGHA
ncbi:MAG: DinB family protein [Thermoplasmata archaeon]